MEGILATHNYTSGDSERTVKPRGKDRAAIYLGIQFHYAALATHLRIRFDTERRRVAVRTYHPETRLTQRTVSDVERIDRRIVLRHIKPVTLTDLSQRLFCVDRTIAGCLKAVRDIARFFSRAETDFPRSNLTESMFTGICGGIRGLWRYSRRDGGDRIWHGLHPAQSRVPSPPVWHHRDDKPFPWGQKCRSRRG